MGKGKITRQEHGPDERRVDELKESFAPRSMRRYAIDPTVKKIRNTELVVVDDGTTRYLAFRLDGELFKVLATASGNFVKVEGDTMTGQLESTVASGAPPFVVASTDNVSNLNADTVDGFHQDQDTQTTGSPEFVDLTLSGLTALRLIATDGSKVLVSVAALTAWIAGTASQIIITDDGDGTITISTPQDIHIGASPTFVGLTLSGLTASRLMATDGAKAADSVVALTSWIAGTANQIAVTDDGDGTVTLSTPQDIHTGAVPSFAGFAKIGDATNYTTIESDGTIEFNGDATVWDDLRIPGSQVQKGASAPDLVAFLGAGNLLVNAFDGGALTEQVYFNVQLSHSYKEGSDITPHVHWSPTNANAGNVKWQLEYTWQNINGTFPAVTTITVVDATDTTAWKHHIAGFSAITGTGKTISSMLVCRLFRNPGDGDDTYGSDAAFLEVDFHFEKDTVGSRQIFTK